MFLYVIAMFMMVAMGGKVFGGSPQQQLHEHADYDVDIDSHTEDDAHGLLGGRGGFGSGSTGVSVAQLSGSSSRMRKAAREASERHAPV